MARRYLYDSFSRGILLVDAIVFVGSLLFAWMIRSQFEWFRYSIVYAAMLFPAVVLFRVFINVFFDHYRVNFISLKNADILGLVVHHLIPSAVLCLMRFLSPYESLRMPLSMIAIEYVFSMFGIVVVRLIAHSILVRRPRGPVGYRRRMLLWLEPEHRGLIDIPGTAAAHNIEFIGILGSNPMFWDTYIDGFRILGDESVIRAVVANDDRICAVCIAGIEDMQLARRERLKCISGELSLEVKALEGGRLVDAGPRLCPS